MGNIEIARLLRKIAAAYTIVGENRFKIIAYENAATAVEHATSEIKDLWEDAELDSVPGLGSSIREHLDELFKTGKSKHFASVLSRVNPAVFPLLDIPGLGPKRAQKLVETLKLRNSKKVIDELEKAAKRHDIAKIPDFGEKSELDILTNIGRFRHGAIKEKRMVLPEADEMAQRIIEYLRTIKGIGEIKVDKLGSLRRRVATIGDVDLAAATSHPQEVVKAFVAYPKAKLIEKGPTGASILLPAGRQADLRVAKLQEYGAMLQYFTGSKYHNVRLRDYALKKGLSLSEYGIKDLKLLKMLRFATEEEFYKFLGMDWIPPELREDTGEIEAALCRTLPKLVELNDIKGDLQMHSSDLQETSHDSGEDSIREMKKIGENLGYQYIGVSDHNPAKNRNMDLLTKRNRIIDHINSSTKGCRVIKLLEVDIHPDGLLPVSQEALSELDGCLVSVHSSFGMNKETMTRRVLTGLSNPVARIFAHPTGRLLGRREGYELDWGQIFRFCLEHDKALEINAYPDRLDLSDTLVREAVKKGVKLTLGTDAHNKEGLLMMKYGVDVARRGWAQKNDIINTRSYSKIISWLRERPI